MTFLPVIIEATIIALIVTFSDVAVHIAKKSISSHQVARKRMPKMMCSMKTHALPT